MPAFTLAVSLLVLSQSALLVRLASGASALDIGFWRMAVAVPVLLLVAAAQGRLGELRRLGSRRTAALLLCGACLFLHWLTWFLAVRATVLANAMVLFAISPVFTAAGAWLFFREPFTRRHGVALAFCLLGVWLIFRDSFGFNPARFRGDCLGLLASLLFSAYVLMGKGIRRELGNLPFTVVVYSSCGALFALVLLARGELHAGFTPGTWAALLGLAVGPTLLGHALFTYCLQFYNVNLMNILILTEPVLGSLGAYYVLGERFTPAVIAGFLTVCVGMAVLFLPGLAPRKRAA
jgi:drug/metabolite transporter (DMT)-like permease